MFVKLPPRDLNPDFCLPHCTNTYTYGMTTTLKVRNAYSSIFESFFNFFNIFV